MDRAGSYGSCREVIDRFAQFMQNSESPRRTMTTASTIERDPHVAAHADAILTRAAKLPFP